MMIDLTGSLKEMSKLVLKAVFVAWNWNCNQWLSGAADYFSTIPSNCKRLKTLPVKKFPKNATSSAALFTFDNTSWTVNELDATLA